MGYENFFDKFVKPSGPLSYILNVHSHMRCFARFCAYNLVTALSHEKKLTCFLCDYGEYISTNVQKILLGQKKIQKKNFCYL